MTKGASARLGRTVSLLTILAAGALGCTQSSSPPPSSPAAAPAVAPAAVPHPSAEQKLEQDLGAILKAYRQVIVLITDKATLLPADRPQAVVVGRYLFEGNRPRLESVAQRLVAEVEEAAVAGFKNPLPLTESFLRTLENAPGWHDADKLAFREIVVGMADRLVKLAPAAPAGKALVTRLAEDTKALQEIQTRYSKELDKIFGQLKTRGMVVRREAWEQYLAFVRTLYSAGAVLDEYRAEVPPPAAAAPVQGAKSVLSGFELPEKTLVLTFDDGPHPRHTREILEILERFKVKAVFYEVGQNIGRVGAGGAITATRASGESRKVLEAGHWIGNHTFSHPLLTKLSATKVSEELDLGTRAVQTVPSPAPALFRPPYGAFSEPVLADVATLKMKTMLWNIDSEDWADPVPASIANRVIREAEEQGRGVVLFHDIHDRSVEALPLVLETLQAEGFRFALWDGREVSVAPPVAARAEVAPPPRLYRENWAVVIGINDYQKWPKLTYAVNDAQAMRDLLVKRLGFKAENVFVLLDAEATRERIMALLGETLADPAKVDKDDRILVFYAGHGATRQLPSGRSLGYIVPVEAEPDKLQSQAISMTNIQDINEGVPAKHVFYVMDACYSGLALVRGGSAAAADPRKYLIEVTRRQAREMLTAGGADQQVADNGPGGHSIFTWTVLQGLEGKGDLNGDGYIGAGELFAYAAPIISSLSPQTPAFGSLVGSEGGEFIFEVQPQNEFLSELSEQLDDEGIKLSAQVEDLRRTIVEKRARNQALQQQVVAAQAELKALGGKGGGETSVERSNRALARGLGFYREKKYAEALKDFQEAFALQPSSAQVANNIGFVFYRLGFYDEAIAWYQKTLALDPNRAIAWANAGEVYDKLGKSAEALEAYGRMLEIAPNHASAAYVRTRIKRLKGEN